ncbi:B12-binding domain-containing protein [Rubinisphaera sp. JC750]|uniref:B12-binding domain-containing protein n=1 Tax=Rubinisphaera sp. JC750 TaxID=2898658 RepID=UPI001F37BC9F|nr:B12-binding domain-containing protein [Rubinisphaera sp. JC750]
MPKLLSPKQVARAIQASESSVKRWCDRGDLEVQYTAGGHRKIPVSSVIAFLRKTGQALENPELLGLPAVAGRAHVDYETACDALFTALVNGKEAVARQILTELYLAEHSLAVIFDRVVTPVMIQVGQKWQCGDVHVFQERRGCEILLQIMQELRRLLPTPPSDAPVAIGGTVSGDLYRLPTAMVEMILREQHWAAASLGDNLPFQTLERAIEQYRPRVFWLSCSHLNDEDEFLRQYNDLYDTFGMSVAFVVGGRALKESLRSQMRYATFCDTMQHLEAFVQTLNNTASKPAEQ